MKLKIKEMRLARNWTLDDVAAISGMSRSYVSEIENGRKNINGKRMEAFARAFGCSPSELIDDPRVDSDLADHLRRLRRLNEEDRLAVIRHAIALDPGDDSTTV